MQINLDDGRSLVPAEPQPSEEKKALEAEIVKTTSKLVKSEKGIAKLEAVLQTHFTPEKIHKYIVDLCEAEDKKLTKNGDEYRTPNWEARKNGLDRVLKLLRYTKDNEATVRENVPSKIVFNIVNTVPKDGQ